MNYKYKTYSEWRGRRHVDQMTGHANPVVKMAWDAAREQPIDHTQGPRGDTGPQGQTGEPGKTHWGDTTFGALFGYTVLLMGLSVLMGTILQFLEFLSK